MKAKKVLALCVAVAMTMSLAACGNEENAGSSNVQESVVEQSSEESTEESSSEVAPESSEDQSGNAAVSAGPASIDFEDGLFGFAGVDKSVNSAADDFAMEVADYAGSKALKVSPNGKKPYVGIQVDALLGDKAADVRTIEMTIGTESAEKFYATSGKIYAFLGENNDRSDAAWSVYLENANPKTVSFAVPDGMSFTAGNYIVVSLETDNGQTDTGTPSTMYIDNIAFKDASGNVLEADTSAEYVAVDTGVDRSNLCALTDVVEFEGFATSANGWAQDGFTMPQEVLDALVPGSVVEISYSSVNGDMWIVMNEAAAGWMRVGQPGGEGTPAYYNSSKNIAQITYEQLAALCGDDVSTWGSTMQCEASEAWEVYSVKVGKKAPSYALADAVEFEGFSTSGAGWAQAGFTMPQEILDALVPGAMVEITYSSVNDDIWIVMNEAEAGWMRVGQPGGEGTPGIADGSKCYISYEQIAALCGDDVSTWGSTMQCEASEAWEVYSVKVGTAQEFKMLNNLVEFEGFNTSANGWAQAGFTMPQEILDALVPGSVVTINYSSVNNDMWVVMNEAEAGWMRVGQPGGEGTPGVMNGSVCQITYEQIAALCGDDVSTWGSTMQCEASEAWEVYSVAVGTAAE